jgi:hypothetical protein
MDPILQDMSFWTEVRIEGSMHFGPAPPTPEFHGNVWRRCPGGGRLNSSHLVKRFAYDDPYLKPIARHYFEPGQFLAFDAATITLTSSMNIQGINAQMIFEPVELTLAGSMLANQQLALEGTVYNVPLPITTKSYLPTSVETGLPPLCTGVTVTQGLTDKMAAASFEFVLATTGGVYSSIYFRDVAVKIPDYAGTMQPVFVGFIPSSTARHGPAEDSETIRAYNYAWYLSMQYLNDADMTILTEESQASQTLHRLYYDFVVHHFKVGDVVVGGTTGDFGKVVAVRPYGYPWIEIENATGIFQHGEQLLVDDELYAYADGHAIDVTGTISSTVRSPETWVRDVLGGTSWQSITGIEPYRLASTSGIYGTTLKLAIDWIFREKQTKIQAIEEVAKYLGFIFVVKHRVSGSQVIPAAYFIQEDEIDNIFTGLDLPAPVTITNPDPYLITPVTLDQDGEEKYNRVTVRCQSFSGKWYSKTLQSSGVDAGQELPIEYYEINPDIALQKECDARCADLWAYYNSQVLKWTATFLKRSDFRLLQQLVFSGYGVQIPNGTYRIVSIQYQYADGGLVNQVTVQLVPDSQFRAYLNLTRVFTESIGEIQAIVKGELALLDAVEAGTVTSAEGGKVVLKTESGQVRTGRDPSS